MAAITAASVACNGKVLIVGLADGLVVSLVAQAKAAPSTKIDIQPSYIATQHARRVTCIAATDNIFATASDDCTLVVSQIGCLFGGEGAAHNSSKGNKLRYRITGAHALPILSLSFLPSDGNLLASASLDGTVVIHRLRFTKAATSASVTLPTVSLAQSVDRLVRLPFGVQKLLSLAPSDGTLLAAAGWDARGLATAAIIDLSVAHRDGDGSGRPLKPFSVLATESPISAASEDIQSQSDTLQLMSDNKTITLTASRPTHAPSATLCQVAATPAALVFVPTSGSSGASAIASATWTISAVLKGIANCRVTEDAKGVVTSSSSDSLNDVHSKLLPLFIGSQGQVATSLAAIVGPNAKPNNYYSSLYVNFCWSTSARPAACVNGAAVAVAQTSAEAASDSSDEEGVNGQPGTAQGLGKRARKTKSRQHRADADAADWARLAVALDSLTNSLSPLDNNETERVPLRYSQLLTSRSVAACESPFEYGPLLQRLPLKEIHVPAENAEEGEVLENLAAQKVKNTAIQARIESLYTALTAAASTTTRKSGREDVSASPSDRPNKRHTSEGSAKKKAISLT